MNSRDLPGSMTASSWRDWYTAGERTGIGVSCSMVSSVAPSAPENTARHWMRPVPGASPAENRAAASASPPAANWMRWLPLETASAPPADHSNCAEQGAAPWLYTTARAEKASSGDRKRGRLSCSICWRRTKTDARAAPMARASQATASSRSCPVNSGTASEIEALPSAPVITAPDHSATVRIQVSSGG
ncbi:MAG: hypothetical protein BWZ10_01281 [candidate division BRC1 bacterium ADurb.BinA364]|nr:MAG: hypothetical protein BWZ10_01281 [candidate division BRC1 bacterium ADurb.BinA364]